MASKVMDFNREDSVRETCLKLGRKFGWFNVALADKVEAVSLILVLSVQISDI